MLRKRDELTLGLASKYLIFISGIRYTVTTEMEELLKQRCWTNGEEDTTIDTTWHLFISYNTAFFRLYSCQLQRFG